MFQTSGTEAPGPSPRRLPPWMPLLVVALAWAAQGGVLGNGWVWDDAVVVRDDPVVAQGVSAVPRLWTRNWFGDVDDVGLYRPLVSASLAIEASLHGTQDPFFFHLTNLFLHGLAAVLFLAVAARCLPGRPVVASTAAILFAVHPLHTGTVSWIVARGDLLAAVFGLLAVLAWLRPGGTTWKNVALAAACTFLAVLGKEMAATIPLVLWLLDAGVRGDGLVGAWKRRPFAYLALFAAIAAYAAMRVAAVGHLGTASAMVALNDRGLVERVWIGAGGLFRTAGRLTLPVGLSGDASNDPLYQPSSPISSAYLAGAVLASALTLLSLVRLARRRAGVADAAWGLFVVLSLPVMQIVPLGAVFEDRFAYVPSLALLLVGGLVAERLLSTGPRALAAAALTAVVLSLGGSAWATAADWRDDFSFNSALLRDDPVHRDAMRRLGRAYLDRGQQRNALAAALPSEDQHGIKTRNAGLRDVREAVDLLSRAAALPSTRNGASTWKALGDAQHALREFPAAIASYQKALSLKRVRLDGRPVGLSEISVGDLPALRDRIARADRSFTADIHYKRGIALEAGGEREVAASAYMAAAAWEPGTLEYAERAGIVLGEIGRPREALGYLAQARALAQGDKWTDLDGAYADARDAAKTKAAKQVAEGRAALEGGETAGALAAFEAAIDAWPDDPAAWDGAVDALTRWKGERDVAIERLKRLLPRLDARDVKPERVDRAAERKKLESLRAQYEK